jgi:8-oxo-dGTP pyrophosphatase MutT (NUDIX family)
MKADLEIHPIQAKILRVLLFNPNARFSQLNSEKISTDQFNFHLKALINAGILDKKDGKYCLTNKGKEFAGRFDVEKVSFEKQAKISLVVVPIKKIKTKIYRLVHQRLKQPYYGYYGAVTGKIRLGEKIFDAAKRELLEETGLKAEKMILIGVFHKTDYSGEKNLLEDKFFFMIRVDKFSGELLEGTSEGKNLWMTEEELLKNPKRFRDIDDLAGVWQKNNLFFIEKDYIVEGY